MAGRGRAYADAEVDDSDMSEEEDEEEEEEDVLAPASAAQRPPPVNNQDGLASALEDFEWPKDLAVVDTLVVVPESADDGGEEEIPDVDDDIARESVFHRRALAAVLAAGAQLVAAGIPVRRPDDYYAEMVKNDAHMRKVKDKLFFEQRELESKAERRRERENKMYGKQVQAEKLKERKAQQKSDMGLLQRMKKRGAGVSSTEVLPDEPDWGAPDLGVSRQRAARGGGGGASGRGAGGGRGGRGGRAGGKREYRESKFGFGGRKKGSKRNDATSAAAGREPAFRSGRSGGRGRGGGRGGRGGRGGQR